MRLAARRLGAAPASAPVSPGRGAAESGRKPLDLLVMLAAPDTRSSTRLLRGGPAAGPAPSAPKSARSVGRPSLA
eukprot:4379184-Pyramimonas_sp.AAC.1